MEYCPTSLAKEDEEFDECRLREAIRDIAKGLQQLHAQDIVHLNIKPRKLRT